MKKHFLFLLSSLTLGSCTVNQFYAPNTQQVIITREKGEVTGNVALSSGFISQLGEVQGSYSVTRNLSIAGAGFLNKNTSNTRVAGSYLKDKVSIVYGEAGLNYSWFAEDEVALGVGAWAGKGFSKNDFQDGGIIKNQYTRLGIQPFIGWQDDNNRASISLSARFNMINFNGINYNQGANPNFRYTDSYNYLGRLSRDNQIFTVEPAATLRLGSPQIQFQLQASFIARYLVDVDVPRDVINFSAGVFIHLAPRFKKK